MNTVMTPVPPDHPMMIAWTAYRASPGFDTAMSWLAHEEHREGQMWAAFMAGWQAGHPSGMVTLDATGLGKRAYYLLRAQARLGTQMRIVPDVWPHSSRRLLVLFVIAIVSVAAITIWRSR